MFWKVSLRWTLMFSPKSSASPTVNLAHFKSSSSIMLHSMNSLKNSLMYSCTSVDFIFKKLYLIYCLIYICWAHTCEVSFASNHSKYWCWPYLLVCVDFACLSTKEHISWSILTWSNLKCWSTAVSLTQYTSLAFTDILCSSLGSDARQNSVSPHKSFDLDTLVEDMEYPYHDAHYFAHCCIRLLRWIGYKFNLHEFGF